MHVFSLEKVEMNNRKGISLQGTPARWKSAIFSHRKTSFFSDLFFPHRQSQTRNRPGRDPGTFPPPPPPPPPPLKSGRIYGYGQSGPLPSQPDSCRKRGNPPSPSHTGGVGGETQGNFFGGRVGARFSHRGRPLSMGGIENRRR